MPPRWPALVIVALLLAGCMGGNRPKTVHVNDLVADFAIDALVPAVGDLVRFEDRSQGNVSSWAWSFGDDELSAEQNPSHRYAKAGDFEVTLTIGDASGQTATASQHLIIGEMGVAAFTLDFVHKVSGRSVEFEPIVQPEDAVVDSYHWDFGDGTRSDQSAPTHAYSQDGVFEVVLRGISGQGISEAKHIVAVGVIVKDASALAARSFAVVAVIDSGINPYHSEFRDDAFDVPPSQYIDAYPADASALSLTLDARTFQAATTKDEGVWANVQGGKLYWIPHTRIIGAISFDPRGKIPILDEDAYGHGTATASDAAGASVGSCPRCLIVAIEGPSEEALDWAFAQPWIDVVSNSWGYCVDLGVGLCQVDTGVFPINPELAVLPSSPFDLLYPVEHSRHAVESGKEVLYASGNGVLNGFDVPTLTYLNGQTGPDWILTVGAADASGGSIVVGTGRPVDVVSYGMNWRAASSQSMNTIREFSGTSAATPIVAGAYAAIVQGVRERLGDTHEGPRPGAIVAEGAAIGGFLDDGKLTRWEAERGMLVTAQTGSLDFSLNPLTLPSSSGSFTYRGYGIVDNKTAAEAIKQITGDAPLASRAEEDQWAAVDSAVRQAVWGPYEAGGETRSSAPDGSVDAWLADLGITRSTLGLA